MAPNAQQGFPLSEIKSTTSKIDNIALTSSIEYAFSLEDKINQLIIRCRQKLIPLQISFSIGESSTKFLTIPAGCTLDLPGLQFESKILYIQSAVNCTVEILQLHN